MSEPVRFGRYSLIKRIAAGGMAEIYLAKQQGPGTFERSLVIKRMLPHLTEDPKFVQMFLDEAALAAQLTHPNIAQVSDFGEEEGSYFIALELIKGPDLRALTRAAKKLGKPVPTEVAVKIVAQTCEALHYAHMARGDDGKPLNIVHRDVSPQNILVSYDGVVKLVDFGIAKASTQGQQTEAGVVKGKFAYLSPEQVRTQRLDGRSDLYAAALVLYELLTLEQGLQGDGAIAIANAMEANVVPITQHRDDLPPELVELLQRALAKDRDERPPSCHAFAEELQGLLVQWGLTVGAPDIARYVRDVEVEAGVPLSAAAGTGASRVDPLPAPDTSPGAQRASRVSAVPRAKAIGSDAEGEIHGNEPTRMPQRSTGVRQALPDAQPPARARTGARPAISEADTTLPPRSRTGTTGARPAVNPEPRARTGARPAISEGDVTLPPRGRAGGFAEPEVQTAPRMKTGARPALQPAPEPEPEDTVDPEAAEPTPPRGTPRPRTSGGRPAVRPAEATPPPRRAEKEEKKGGGFLSGLLTFLVFAGMLGGGVYGVWWKILGPGKEPEPTPVSTELPKPPPQPEKPPAALLPAGPTGATGATGAAEAKPQAKPETKSHGDASQPEVADKGETKPHKREPKEPKSAPGVEEGKAGLQVESTPEADVLLDGQSLGPTPFKGNVAPGQHQLVVQVTKYGLRREMAVELAAGAWSKQSVEFKKGKVNFKAIPWAEVTFAGAKLDKPTPTSTKAWEGTYEVVFTHEGKTEKRSVTVKGGEEQELVVDFSGK